MKKEIKIILPSETPQSKKGGIFEDMLRTVLEAQGYGIAQNVNFTGLEIDLLAEHTIRKGERLYVECKAKDKPNSGEIKSFAFGVGHKKASFGYFIHTNELEHQAAGLRTEILESDDPNYKKLSFLGPNEILELLENSAFIDSFESKEPAGKRFTKLILALTHFGKYYIALVAGSTMPSSFICVKADNVSGEVDHGIVEQLRIAIPEINDLEYIVNAESATQKPKKITEIETISELATGESWFDYQPTNPKFFVGRDQLMKESFRFFEDVKNKKTDKRLFYLEGKSGWGKSSFIANIRDKARSVRNRGKYFVYAVDYRSALSNNFASIAFSKMIEKAKSEGFVPKKSPLKITSAFDILSSNEVKELLAYLEKEEKLLILVFDQFEDAFRQGTFFKSFYKLLIDAHDVGTNLIVGFSWKTEINIPADHEAYYLWQQVKSNAVELKMPEFGLKELRAVTRQLEKDIDTELPNELRIKLIEISQGFPWLIKKLCIHVLEQVKSGKTLEVLQEEDMNIEILFKQDLEKLTGKDSELLHYIAKRAYDGKQFDVSETDEPSEPIIKGLINQRLVIKSGTKHNIYWDVFRDYLVEGKVPEIGEIYLLRYQPLKAYKILEIIKRERRLSVNDFEKLEKHKLVHGTYQNYFRLLKDLRVISTDEVDEQKYDDDKKYHIAIDSLTNLSEDKYKDFLHEKFKRYAPLIRLQKLGDQKTISQEEAQNIVKETFRGRNYNATTWSTYTLILMTWLKYAGYRLNISAPPKLRTSRSEDPLDRFLTNFPRPTVAYAYSLSCTASSDVSKGRKAKLESDLSVLEMLSKNEGKFELISEFLGKDEEYLRSKIASAAGKLLPVKKIVPLLQEYGTDINADFIVRNLPELFVNARSSEYRKTLANVLKAWAKLVAGY